MSHATVHTIVVDPSGTPLPNIYTEIALLAPNVSDYAWDTDDGHLILSRFVTRTDSNGQWSVSLIRTADITPDNTVYRVTHHIPGLPDEVSYFNVPGAGPYLLNDVLVNPPTALAVPSVNIIIKNSPPEQGSLGYFSITKGQTPTTGTFTLTFRDQTTAPIAFDADSSAVATALSNLSTVDGNVTFYPGMYPNLSSFSGSTFLVRPTLYFQWIGNFLFIPTESPTITDSTDGGLFMDANISPITPTVGALGQFYFDDDNNVLYERIANQINQAGTVTTWEVVWPENQRGNVGWVQAQAQIMHGVNQVATPVVIKVSPHGQTHGKTVSTYPLVDQELAPLIDIAAGDEIEVAVIYDGLIDFFTGLSIDPNSLVDTNIEIVVWNAAGTDALWGVAAGAGVSATGSVTMAIGQTEVIGADLTIVGSRIHTTAGGRYNILLKSETSWD